MAIQIISMRAKKFNKVREKFAKTTNFKNKRAAKDWVNLSLDNVQGLNDLKEEVREFQLMVIDALCSDAGMLD